MLAKFLQHARYCARHDHVQSVKSASPACPVDAVALEGPTMATNKRNKPGKVRAAAASARDLMKVGDCVRILNYGGQKGRIVEFRGPLGPAGARIYRIMVRGKSER